MPTGLARVAIGSAIGFAALAGRIVVAGDLPGDRRVLSVLATSADSSDSVARVVARMTGYEAVGLLTVLLVVTLVLLGRARSGVLAAASVAGALVGTTLLKQVVDRPRPAVMSPLEDVSPLSFPSGHAAATAALAVVVVLLTAGSRWLPAALVAGGLLVVVAATAQLVLARHHPSDILGGWLWAVTWTAAVWAGGAARAGRRSSGGRR